MRIPQHWSIREYHAIKDEVQSAISEVLEDWATHVGDYVLGATRKWVGENVRAFEEEFAKYCDVKYGVGVSSGSMSLVLALKSLKIGEGDEVITVPNTFIATAEAIAHCLAKPVFVDVNPETYNINVSEIEKKITKKTKAILLVHQFGHPADIKPIQEISEEHGLSIIEDASHAHGATYAGRKVGGLGDCACFSLAPIKPLGAYGYAGIITTDNEEMVENARLLKGHGSQEPYRQDVDGINELPHHHVSNLSEIQAAILSVKLKYLNEWNKSRRRIAGMYNRLLSDLPGVICPVEKEYAKHVYYVYVIRYKDRDRLAEELHAKGVSTRVHYPVPIHLTKAFQYLGLRQKSFPVTEKLVQEVLSLPMFPQLEDDEVYYVCENIKKIVTS